MNSIQIVGTGIDIVEVKRIRTLAKRNKRFLPRVFSIDEIKYCSRHKNQWQHYAVRFAAKEAVWKALSNPNLPLKYISVKNTVYGKPEVIIKGRKVKNILLSLSHCSSYAMAQAIAIKK